MKILPVFLWIFSSRGVTGVVGTSALLYTFFATKYSLLPLIYLIWLAAFKFQVFGRRSYGLRHSPLWRYYCQYFPLRLEKTTELEPNRNYIFSCHPHGVFAFGPFGNFATEGTNVSKLFPGLSMHFLMHGLPLKLPFMELLTSLGIMSVDASSFETLLKDPSRGRVAALIPGGLQEVVHARPGANVKLYLMNRKGFVRMALKYGAALVPVFTFGENESFHQVNLKPGVLLYDILRFLGLHLLLPNGKGILTYQLPIATPITTVVGTPLEVPKIPNPTKEDVDTLHQRYIVALRKLFEENKGKYNAENLQLLIE